ncbi:DUF58 domain-containing protein [Actinokineospora bangkokensis]|uniref:DUF58 domain-containing protein n=1 Tax=Actinokineospora bangkokensis TaxID=1193682 RepID=A0A1Q9LU04_9PSEU|nr:DUF58 domain-containing protein [Actinokineospora bangkokensis]OLR95454.1 hypothetical protein BJP25_06845 [Actinokineospora bangkokensis]
MRRRPTRRGATALALGVLLVAAGLWWRYPGPAALGVALVLLAAAGLAAVLVAAPVRPDRAVRPLTVARLGRCTGTLVITSVSKRLRVAVEATERVAGEPLPVRVPLLEPGSATSVEYPIPTERRGVLEIGPLTLLRLGPAGLAVARTEVGGVVEVRVVPRVLPVRGLPSGVRRGVVGADERVERGGTDLVGLREYVPGDDLRRLHWATSARTGTLMVREDADPARPHLVVLLDDAAAAYPDPVAFEHAVECAASLLTAAARDGNPGRLLTTSGGVDAALDDAGTGPVLAALAEVGTTAGPEQARVPLRDLDVVVAVTGPAGAEDPLLLEAGRAAVGVLLVVDEPAPAAAAGSVLVLRGPTAEALLHAWDVAVAR